MMIDYIIDSIVDSLYSIKDKIDDYFDYLYELNNYQVNNELLFITIE